MKRKIPIQQKSENPKPSNKDGSVSLESKKHTKRPKKFIPRHGHIKKVLSEQERKEKTVALKKKATKKNATKGRYLSLRKRHKRKKTNLFRPTIVYETDRNERSFLFQNEHNKAFVIFVLIGFLAAFVFRGTIVANSRITHAKESVISNAESGLEFSKSASSALADKNFQAAITSFDEAAVKFADAKQELDSTSKGATALLQLLPGNNQVTTGENILVAGENLALAGEHITTALHLFSKSDDTFQAIKDNPDDYEKISEKPADGASLTQALNASNENLEKALTHLQQAETALNGVDPSYVPESARGNVIILKETMPQITGAFQLLLSYTDMLLEILGHENFKRYLVLFQNNSEIRPTGGFIGTYGLIDVDEGKITGMKVEGPYNVDGQLKDVVKSPEAMHLINERFYMRDANWFPDFPTSAKRVAAYHEKAGGPSVNGVISVNASIIIELLKITGPVEIPEYDLIITADNFLEETQREVEISYDKELNRPKKFISDLIPKMLEKMSELEPEKWGEVLSLVITLFDQKDIQIFFYNQELEQRVQSLGWGGQIERVPKDYLNIVATNIGGGKTDNVINQNAHIETQIQPDGSVVNTVTLIRKHEGSESDFWTRVKNVSYTRFYVPEGSELISAEGFDDILYETLKEDQENAQDDPVLAETEGKQTIHALSGTRVYNESGKTVFGNYVGVEAGLQKVVQVKYKLPFSVVVDVENPVGNYSMYYQKQSGLNPIEITHGITIPKKLKSTWFEATEGQIEEGNSRLEATLSLRKDEIIALVLSRYE